MKTNNYPNWLVPIEIAKKLKEIDFDKECAFVCTLSNEIGFITKNEGYYHYLDEVNFDNYNKIRIVSVPTWTDVFEWFREKGFKITIENHEDSTKIMFYNMTISNGKHFKWELSTYEQACETLVEKLIEIYK
jgi:hypothetical protein|nr:MAG TPA: hypothetical protein [Caudoviricetes sp.]